MDFSKDENAEVRREAHAALSELDAEEGGIHLVPYASEEEHLGVVSQLIEKDLSEPYSVFTYRCFINNWPDLTFLAVAGEEVVGTVVGRLEAVKGILRGYIAMLAVDHQWRRRGIGSRLVRRVISQMALHGAHEVTLEAETTNVKALKLYSRLGFAKESRMRRYYMHGGDAFSLILRLDPETDHHKHSDSDQQPDHQ